MTAEPDHDGKANPEAAIPSGTTAGRYLVLEGPDSTCLGEVYRARDTRLGRMVQLYFLPSSPASDEELKTRLARTVQAVAALACPGLTPVYDISEYNERPFVVTEYTESRPLSDLIRCQPLSLDRTLQTVVSVAEALRDVHRSGILYGDLRPCNVLVDKNERCQLAVPGLLASDFGTWSDADSASSKVSAYRAPEAVRGTRPDTRSDIYSLGVLLCEMITGSDAFLKAGPAATVRSIAEEGSGSDDRWGSSLPEAVLVVVRKALQAEPEARYQCVDELLDDLRYELAQRTFRESEESYRSLLESAREVIFIVNQAGVFLYMNRYAAERLTGEPSFHIGKSMWDVFPQHVADRQMGPVRQVFESGCSQTVEMATEIQGQSYRYNTSLQPIRDESGTIVSVLGIARSVDEFASLQEELARQRGLVSTLLDTANSLVVCLDRKARITVFNGACERVTGYTRAEVLGKSWPDTFLPADHKQPAPEDFGQWVRQHPRDMYEGQLRTKDGQFRTILWSTSAVFSPDSDELTAIAVGQDITERKLAERTLREAEARFGEVLEYSRDVLYRLNLDTLTYDYISSSVLEMTGYRPDEVIAGGVAKMRALVHPEDLKRFGMHREELIQSDADSDTAFTTEYRLKVKDGTYRWLSDSHALVRDSEGSARFIIGTVRDITEHKQADEALQRAHDELERRVEQRTGELVRINRDLRQHIEDRLKAQQALLESEEKYRNLVERANDGICILQGGLLKFVNQRLAEMVGYTVEEVLNTPFVRYVHPDDVAGIAERYRLRMAGGELDQGHEAGLLHRNGQRIEVEMNGNLVTYEGRPGDLTFVHDITERKRSREALQASRRRYEQASIGGRVGVWDQDLVTGEFFVDAGLKALLGFADHEIGSQLDVWTERVHPDDVDRVTKDINAVINGAVDKYEMEHRMIHRDGSVRWFLSRGKAIRDAEGKPCRIVGTDTDITDRKEAEEALRESEERFRKLSDAAEEGIVIHDHGVIVDANEAFARMTGYEQPEVIGMHIRPFTTAESWQTVAEHLAADSDEPYEATGIRKDGSTLYCQLVGKSYEWQGKTLRVTVLRDITSRKQAEEALFESRRALATLMSNLPGMAYRCRNDPDWTMLFVSNGCKELTGYESAELVGNTQISYNEVIHPGDRAQVFEVVDNGLGGDRPFQMVYRIITRDRQVKWVWEKGRGVYSDDGQLVALEGFITDITERKRVEDMLRQTTDELEVEREDLTDKNIALEQILKHIDKERQDYKARTCRDMEQAITPILKRLRESAGAEHSNEMEALETNLQAILAKDVDVFRDRYASLTPREVEVCEMIKKGLSSKQIASHMNLSLYTVHKHREQIREKLGITNKRVNLSTYLQLH
ncbi:MAG TPA: PAS domain S-box protein [Acidobacteriota bacterium]|nr:PAS domain S-box protein [Acidobacteriota bacterium]